MRPKHDVAQPVVQTAKARPGWPDHAIAGVLTAVLIGVPAFSPAFLLAREKGHHEKRCSSSACHCSVASIQGERPALESLVSGEAARATLRPRRKHHDDLTQEPPQGRLGSGRAAHQGDIERILHQELLIRRLVELGADTTQAEQLLQGMQRCSSSPAIAGDDLGRCPMSHRRGRPRHQSPHRATA